MKLLPFALIALLLLAGCGSGEETKVSSDEKARFGGSKPPPEMLEKLQGRTPSAPGTDR